MENISKTNENNKDSVINLMDVRFKGKESKIFFIIDIILSIVIRIWFIVHCSFYVYLLVSYEKNRGYLAMIDGLVVIVIDGIFVMIKRKGKEYSW